MAAFVPAVSASAASVHDTVATSRASVAIGRADSTVRATLGGKSGAGSRAALKAVGHVKALTVPACTDTWTGDAGDGQWSTSGNWSTGEPGSATVACITTPGATVDVQNSQVAASLQLGGTTGSTVSLVLDGAGCQNSGGDLDLESSSQESLIGATGDLALSSAGCGGQPDDLTIAGELTVDGTLEVDSGTGGGRTISGDIDNSGTIAIKFTTDYTSGSLDNSGAINIADSAVLQVTSNAGATVTDDTGGSITTSGDSSSGQLVLAGGNTYVQGAGTTSGASVLVNNSAIQYTGGGASTITAWDDVTLTGNISKGQTLTLEGAACDNSGSFVTLGASLSSAGDIEMTAGGCGGQTDILTMPTGDTLTNKGTLQTDAGSGGSRTISGDLVNDGTVNLNTATTYESGTWDNAGPMNIADDVKVTVADATPAATFTDASGGSVTSTGDDTSGYLFVDTGNTYTQGAGTTSGSAVVVNNSAISYTGAGASSLTAWDDVTLTGNISSGQTLTLLGGGCINSGSLVTLGASLSSAGDIEMTAGGCGGQQDSLTVPTGDILTNTGTLQTDSGTGGSRTISGDIDNSGTVNINTATSYASGSWDNIGALNIADSMALTVAGSAAATFTDGNGGSIVTSGDASTGDLFVSSGNTYVQGAGTTSGGPVYVDGSALEFTGAGAASITAWDDVTLSGNIAAGQTLTLEGAGCQNGGSNVTLAASLTSAGQIEMTAGGCGGDPDTLTVPAGDVLTNTGTIETDPGTGSSRTINGDILNGTLATAGHIVINANSTFNPNRGLENDGSITVATGTTFTVSQVTGARIYNSTNGSITTTGTGAFVIDGDSYLQGAGKVVGAGFSVVNGTTEYVGTGHGRVYVEGTSSVLTGDTHPGQILIVAGVACGPGPATLTDTSSLTNGGDIYLGAGGCGGETVTLSLPTSGTTLTNTGLIKAVTGTGGARTISANVVNSGVIGPNGDETVSIGGTFTQTSSGTLNVSVGSNSSDALAVTGAASLGGQLVAVPVSGFTPSNGDSWDILNDSAGAVSGTFSSVTGPSGTWTASYTSSEVKLNYSTGAGTNKH